MRLCYLISCSILLFVAGPACSPSPSGDNGNDNGNANGNTNSNTNTNGDSEAPAEVGFPEVIGDGSAILTIDQAEGVTATILGDENDAGTAANVTGLSGNTGEADFSAAFNSELQAERVTIGDAEIAFDYTGTDPQAPAFTNCAYSSAAAGTLLTFLMHVNPDMPHNDGMLRPITIHIPEGTFLNAKFPAATTFGNQITDPNSEAVFLALSQAVPSRVTAAWNRLLAPRLTGRDPRTGKMYIDVLFMALKGGSGATEGVDGYDHIGTIVAAGGILAQDYEMMELQDPHLLLKHEYLPESAGAGQWRGGLGVETIVRLDGEETVLVVHGDGLEEGAFGLFGGTAGIANRLEVIKPDGSSFFTKCKDIHTDIPQGTILHQLQGGGGGYGDPHKRTADLVLRDVRNGLLSPESARDIYGVAIDCETWSIDHAATATLRGE